PADHRVHGVLPAGAAGGLVGAGGHHGVLVAGVGVAPLGGHPGAHGFEGLGGVHAIYLVHGDADPAADVGADQGAGDDGRGAATAAPHLGAENAAEQAADDHAGLFVLALVGGAAGNGEGAGGDEGEQGLAAHGESPGG